MAENETVEQVVDDAPVQSINDNTVVNEEGMTPSGESETQPAEGNEGAETVEQTTDKVEPKKISESDEIIRKIREDERGKTKAAREEARQAREAADKALRLAEQLSQQRQPQQAQEEVDPDMPLTRREWEQIEHKKEQERFRKEQESRIVQSAKKAKDKYSKTDFTYEEALEYAQNNFSQGRMMAILQAEDPAEELYNLVSIQPDVKPRIVEGVQKETVKKTVETLNKHLNQTGTLSKAGGSDRAIDEIKKWEQMSYADILKEQDKIIASR